MWPALALVGRSPWCISYPLCCTQLKHTIICRSFIIRLFQLSHKHDKTTHVVNTDFDKWFEFFLYKVGSFAMFIPAVCILFLLKAIICSGDCPVLTLLESVPDIMVVANFWRAFAWGQASSTENFVSAKLWSYTSVTYVTTSNVHNFLKINSRIKRFRVLFIGK